ncbi:MAG: glycosyltransferase [Bacteroidota bacterium]
MKFSVVIPTYLEELYLASCLEAIGKQQYERKEFEIIVSDSQSSDGTERVAKERADRVVSTPQRGIAHGRNIGAKETAGEFLVFVDADVHLGAEFLARCEKAFRDENVVGMTGIAKPEGGTVLQRLTYRMTYLLVRVFQAFGLSLYPGLCVAYRRKAFETVGGFREDFGVVEDLDLSRRVSKLGRCVVDSQAVATVSTRRLRKFGLSTVLFHVYNDLRYLLTGNAARFYPKTEETNSWLDIWRVNN